MMTLKKQKKHGDVILALGFPQIKSCEKVDNFKNCLLTVSLSGFPYKFKKLARELQFALFLQIS